MPSEDVPAAQSTPCVGVHRAFDDDVEAVRIDGGGVTVNQFSTLMASANLSFTRSVGRDRHTIEFLGDGVSPAPLTRVREIAPKTEEDLDALDADYAAIHCDHPFHASPDFLATLRRLLDQPKFQSILDVK